MLQSFQQSKDLATSRMWHSVRQATGSTLDLSSGGDGHGSRGGGSGGFSLEDIPQEYGSGEMSGTESVDSIGLSDLDDDFQECDEEGGTAAAGAAGGGGGGGGAGADTTGVATLEASRSMMSSSVYLPSSAMGSSVYIPR